jgi:hypothetical protein
LPTASAERAVARWAAGIAASVVGSLVVLGLTLVRQIDQDVAAVRVQLLELRHWVEDIEESVRTNRMTRMAPETRAEIDALRRELAAAQGRIEALESRRGMR